MTQKRFILAAGGTGGHVFPAKALAELMLAEGHELLFCTDVRGKCFLQDIPVNKVKVISSGGLVTGSVFQKISGVMRLGRGYLTSRRILSKFKPHAVIGFGGYPSAPPLLAAQHMKIPTILHEQNSVMGKANRLIGKDATKVAISFAKTTGAPKASVFVGNPIRTEIEQVGENEYVSPAENEDVKILVLGGSLGATFLSNIVPTALGTLTTNMCGRLHVIQQARGEDLTRVVKSYERSGINADVVPFVDDVAAALRDCHLVICRAGATSVAEVAAAGRPAIFIPLDIHADRHQVINAESLAKEGAAWVQPQSETSAKILSNLIASLIEQPNRLKTVADKAKSLAKTGSAKSLYDLTLSFSA